MNQLSGGKVADKPCDPTILRGLMPDWISGLSRMIQQDGAG